MQTGREGDYHYVTVTSQAEANALNAKVPSRFRSARPLTERLTDRTFDEGRRKRPFQGTVRRCGIDDARARARGGCAEAAVRRHAQPVNSLGGTAQAKLDRQYEQLGARVNQNLVSRGLSNGSVAINAQRAVNLDKAFATKRPQ